MKMIRLTSELKEGEVFLKWLHSRLIKHNKNVLGCNLGPTGSGKSYRDLRMAELWYNYHFHKLFPADNICFGVLAALRRISSKELNRGDIIIFEESGAGLGSLDFQSKTSKMFTYVLQSFRSMNIGIFFNLPYLSMLNKQARMLMHYSFESAGVDFERKINVCKPFLQQVNQKTGKIYSKYPRIKVNGKMKTFKKFEFNLPSKYLIDAYESKKLQYLHDTTKQYTDELEKLEFDKIAKLSRKELDGYHRDILERHVNGETTVSIAKFWGKTPTTIGEIIQNMGKWGYNIDKKPKNKEKIPLNQTTELIS